MITPSRPSDNRQADWTITRCNRFLRPLVSRIATLRKLKERREALAAANAQIINYGPMDAPQPSKRRERSPSLDSSESKENDPDWMNGPAKKRKTAMHYAARPNPAATPLVRSCNSRPRLLPGELSIPTPYISRAAPAGIHASNQQDDTTELALAKSRNVGRPKSSENDIVSAKFMSKMENESQLVQNLVKGFLDLMDATNTLPPNTPTNSSRGSRSLLATCLRQVPTFIANEEARLASKADEDDSPCDVGAEVYEFLGDTFEIVQGRGWRHMREVVRAHGVSLMKSAIEDGLLSREDTRTIIRHLLRPQRRQSTQPSPEEAETLMSALIATETPFKPAKCCASRNQFYAQSLNNVGSLSSQIKLDSRHPFEFRGFTKLALSNYVPIEWMATARVLPLWSNMFRMLFDRADPEFRDAYRFLEVAVSVGTGLEPTSREAQKVLAEVPAQYVQQHEACPRCPRPATGTFLVRPLGEQQAISKNLAVARTQLCTAFSNTLSSLSTIMSSFTTAARIDSTQCGHTDPHLPLWILSSLSLDILLHHKPNLKKNGQPVSKYAARRSVHVLASTLISQVAGCQLKAGYIGADPNDLVDCINMFDTASGASSFDDLGIMESLPDMICSIAQGSSKISKAPHLNAIQHLVRSLCKPQISGIELTSSSLGFLRCLALSSAVECARRYKTPEYHALVREIERNMSRSERSKTVSTPARSFTKKIEEEKRGFRWEEGICEWVAATPYVAAKRDFADGARLLAPAEALPPAPDDYDEISDHGADAYMSPATSSHPSEDMEEETDSARAAALRLSDLLAQSSPADTTTLVSKRLDILRRRNHERSRSFDNDIFMSNKRHRSDSSSSQESSRGANEQGHRSKRNVRNPASSDVASGKSAHLAKQRLKKRTLSERCAINSSSDDELSVGSSPKQPSRKRGNLSMNHTSRRQPASRLLLSFSATTRPPKRLASAHVTDTEDDELSIL